MKTDFLTKIVEEKKMELVAAEKRVPIRQLRDEALKPRQPRKFIDALAQQESNRVNIIAEIKRASPSKGPIRLDLNPVWYATEYELGGASALSVLTEQNYFMGSLEDLKAVRRAVSIPVLRKDFIVSEYQIYESAAWHADAVLLIVRVLSEQQLSDYLALCNELQLDALVEVHSESDIAIAAQTSARLVGINNRNLKSFETNIDIAAKRATLLSPGQIAVAESGIKSREDIETLRRAGIWNFLIGESLVRAENPRQFLRQLKENV